MFTSENTFLLQNLAGINKYCGPLIFVLNDEYFNIIKQVISDNESLKKQQWSLDFSFYLYWQQQNTCL